MALVVIAIKRQVRERIPISRHTVAVRHPTRQLIHASSLNEHFEPSGVPTEIVLKLSWSTGPRPDRQAVYQPILGIRRKNPVPIFAIVDLESNARSIGQELLDLERVV